MNLPDHVGLHVHPEIVTIKADKGNTTVIMEKSEYI